MRERCRPYIFVFAYSGMVPWRSAFRCVEGRDVLVGTATKPLYAVTSEIYYLFSLYLPHCSFPDHMQCMEFSKIHSKSSISLLNFYE